MSGQVVLMLPSLWLSLPILSSTFKVPCDYIESTHVIQDNLVILKLASGEVQGIIHLCVSPLSCLLSCLLLLPTAHIQVQ